MKDVVGTAVQESSVPWQPRDDADGSTAFSDAWYWTTSPAWCTFTCRNSSASPGTPQSRPSCGARHPPTSCTFSPTSNIFTFIDKGIQTFGLITCFHQVLDLCHHYSHFYSDLFPRWFRKRMIPIPLHLWFWCPLSSSALPDITAIWFNGKKES